jgi:hypothetical protein
VRNEFSPGEQWLPAVQDKCNAGCRVPADVLSNARGRVYSAISAGIRRGRSRHD